MHEQYSSRLASKRLPWTFNPNASGRDSAWPRTQQTYATIETIFKKPLLLQFFILIFHSHNLSMAPARDNEFLPEVWGLYSLGTLWIVLRFAVRLRMDGIKGLRLDDGLALVALTAWTYTCAIIQITYYTGTNSDFTAAEVATFDQRKFDEVVYGSKLFLGSWYA